MARHVPERTVVAVRALARDHRRAILVRCADAECRSGRALFPAHDRHRDGASAKPAARGARAMVRTRGDRRTGVPDPGCFGRAPRVDAGQSWRTEFLSFGREHHRKRCRARAPACSTRTRAGVCACGSAAAAARSARRQLLVGTVRGHRAACRGGASRIARRCDIRTPAGRLSVAPASERMSSDDEKTRSGSPLPPPTQEPVASVTAPDSSPAASGAATSPNALGPGFDLREFEIERVIGEGGFSIVYLAIDRQLVRRIAIKEYMPSALALRTRDLTIVSKSERVRETFDAGLRSFVNEAQL